MGMNGKFLARHGEGMEGSVDEGWTQRLDNGSLLQRIHGHTPRGDGEGVTWDSAVSRHHRPIIRVLGYS